jgi:hypothetical protein
MNPLRSVYFMMWQNPSPITAPSTTPRMTSYSQPMRNQRPIAARVVGSTVR